MQHQIHEPDALAASTILSLCCLVLLLTFYIAIAVGIAGIAQVALPDLLTRLVTF